MNLTLARELLHERGYTLDMRDSQQSTGRTICRVYATREGEEHFLCSMSEFFFLSVKSFQDEIARLPERERTS